MLFSSLEFLYFFLPISVALYFVCPKRIRNLFLFAVSLAFYGFGEPLYVFLMLFTVVADYLFALIIEKTKKQKRLFLWTSVIFNPALLGFFKYYNFFAEILRLPALDVSLPIGISFYTFQALSYVIDVYRESTAAEKNIIDLGAYVSLYPQLIAGPIVKYTDISAELKERKHSIDRVADGFCRFSAGLAKKVLLANGAGELSDRLFSSEQSALSLWLGLLLYAFQIYYDFSGYSDMAVGLGRIFGFDFPENFNYPYISKSITEFWRRWHITLSSWFREYVYIPLGGNRRGIPRTYLNLFIVWLLTGLWHGAAWNFVLWGLYFFVLLVAEKAFLLKLLKKLPSVLSHLYALFFILLGWLIFKSDGATLFALGNSFLKLFSVGIPTLHANLGYETVRNLPFLLIMCVGATPLCKRLYERLQKRSCKASLILRNALALLSVILCTAYLTDVGYNPFLYFRF